MDELLKWMVDNGLAQNRWNAEHIYRGLQLDGLDIQQAQVRCYVYREWRRSGENGRAAFTNAIEGKDPPSRLFGDTDVFLYDSTK